MTISIITSIIVWAITGALGAVVTYLGMRYKKVVKENDALKNGMQSLLRNNIIDAHDKYTKKKFCPIYAKESVTKTYEAYHALGGNGVITKLYNDIMALPEQPPVARKKKSSGGEEV